MNNDSAAKRRRHRIDHGKVPDVTRERELESYERLCLLSPAQLDAVIEHVDAPRRFLPGRDAPVASVARELLQLLRQRDGGLDDLEDALEAAATARQGAAGAAVDDAEIRQYLSRFRRRMRAENHGGLAHQAFVTPEGTEIEPAGILRGDWAPPVSASEVVTLIRRYLRELTGPDLAGERASAQLAAHNRTSRRVRNVVRALEQSAEPIVLLGDPGSGKSMVVRQVGVEIAARQLRRSEPSVVVYARLGQYRSARCGRPGDVMAFLRETLLPDEERIARMLPHLAREGRLILLFDGMDEMDRDLYGARVQALSRFADTVADSVKTLFTCRINDFSPEFEHRQMVLLPFSRDQVYAYLKGNLPRRTVVDRVGRSASQILRELESTPGLADAMANPLMLFLFCYYLRHRATWPNSRRDLFAAYVVGTFRNRLLQHPIGMHVEEEDFDRLRHLWSHMAFLITRYDGGVYVARSLLLARLGEETAEEALRIGVHCGLLIVEPGAKAQVRFSHHRLQEYLTALHLARPEGLPPDQSVDWSAVLDVARWQEVLINLVSISGSVAAIETLEFTLDRLCAIPEEEPKVEPAQHDAASKREGAANAADKDSSTRAPKPKNKKAAPSEAPKGLPGYSVDEERLAADRVVLISHILREIVSRDETLPKDFRKKFQDAVTKAARKGLPTTQVKMLWVCSNVPDLPLVDVLNGPLRSPIDWVREQALMVIAGTDPLRRAIGTEMETEMALDLSQGRFFARFRVYCGAARRAGGAHMWWAIGWTSVCQVLFGLILVGYGLFSYRQFCRAFPLTRDSLIQSGAGLATLAVAAGLCTPVLSRWRSMQIGWSFLVATEVLLALAFSAAMVPVKKSAEPILNAIFLTLCLLWIGRLSVRSATTMALIAHRCFCWSANLPASLQSTLAADGIDPKAAIEGGVALGGAALGIKFIAPLLGFRFAGEFAVVTGTLGVLAALAGAIPQLTSGSARLRAIFAALRSAPGTVGNALAGALGMGCSLKYSDPWFDTFATFTGRAWSGPSVVVACWFAALGLLSGADRGHPEPAGSPRRGGLATMLLDVCRKVLIVSMFFVLSAGKRIVVLLSTLATGYLVLLLVLTAGVGALLAHTAANKLDERTHLVRHQAATTGFWLAFGAFLVEAVALVWHAVADAYRVIAIGLLAVVGALVLIPLGMWLLRLRLNLHYRWFCQRASKEAWLAAFTGRNPWEQALLLRHASRQAMGLTAPAFLACLRELNSVVTEEPGLSAYWAAVGDLEQILRQDQLIGSEPRDA